MLALKKDLPRPIAPPPNGSALKAVENFDVDLRDALAHTTVSELTFDEFLRVLNDLTRRRAS
ncbi:MAG TPA: hypothetical protein PKD04_07955 [Rhodocyclaceae bacterium]|jgi:hypothetical protein|nr:hypothetical protein [Betaproteobacteria bacterium]HMV01001.1 hypothetical protein [Rhodocyclaceae bacterium]HMV21593.1 hypothetical protein [Rhodocyclaceae bacterium]HMW77943.1 hypothetical protein [Rhodocyclaceae bacterium]HNE43769.1 hypothetical protein [Rhodocyclaceae bacterium]